MPIDSINKTRVLVPAITAVLVVMAAPMLLPAALAAPTLHEQNCEVEDANLFCEFDVSGLGSAESAEGTLTGDASITTGCINRGDNEPSGLERETVDVVESEEVNVEGGRATFTLSTDFDAEELRDCPSRQMRETIVCAEFTDLSLEVNPSSGPSRTFDIPDEGDC